MFYYLLFNILIFSILGLFYKKYFTHNKKLKFDSFGDKKEIILQNINFYDINNKLIMILPKNKNILKFNLLNNESKIFDFSFHLFNYDYIIINFIYNNNIYKWLGKNNIEKIKFPIYNKEDLKNYVYINKIGKVIIDDKNLDDLKNCINEFLGPNYNFYKELDYTITPKQILNYLNIQYKSDSILHLYDRFNNKFSFKINEKLYWDPVLKL